VVTHVARFVSMGQLPLGRADAARKVHDDETRQRRRLQKAAARRLDAPQNFERPGNQGAADKPCDGARGRQKVMPRLADGDQGGQCVTDDRQSQPLQPRVRAGRKFKRQGRNVLPGVGRWAEAPGQRGRRQDGRRERAVFAVPRDDGRRHVLRVEVPDAAVEPLLGGSHGPLVGFNASRRRREGRPHKRGCAEVAL
jgi:hypothetical protein